MHFSATNVFSSRKLPVFSKRQKGSHKGNFGWCPRRRRRRSFRKCGVLCCVKKSMCQSWLQEVAQSFALNLCAVVVVVVARGLAYVRSSPYHCKATENCHCLATAHRHRRKKDEKKVRRESQERSTRRLSSLPLLRSTSSSKTPSLKSKIMQWDHECAASSLVSWCWMLQRISLVWKAWFAKEEERKQK